MWVERVARVGGRSLVSVHSPGVKSSVGALPLVLFNRVQEPLLLAELMKLEGSVEIAEAAGLSCLDERLAALQIYRVQLRRILVNSLYFLEVKADGNCFYKIGVTTRSIEQRIAEVQRDVRAHYSDVVVNLLGREGTPGECGTVLQTSVQNV